MKLLAIDGNSILNRAFYGVRLLQNKNGVYTNAIFGFLNILLKLQRDIKPDMISIAFDVKAKTFRHKKYDYYKANRKGMPQELAMQLQPMKDILRAMGHTVIEKEGYEADDILGTLSKICSDTQNQCVVATGDRDALQLINENVTVCLVKTKENLMCDIERIKLDYGVEPLKIIDIKALMGDSSDNITGVKGIGEKTALNLVQNYGGIDSIYENIDEIKATPRVKKLLTEGKDSAYDSKELATICLEVPIDLTIEQLQTKDVDKITLSKLLMEFDLLSFFNKLGIENVAEIEGVEVEKKVLYNIQVNPTVEEVDERVKNSDTIDFMLEEDKLLFFFGEDIVVITENIDDYLKKSVFMRKWKPKRTFNAKIAHKKAMQMQLELKNVAFDIELAAYLLNVSSKEYKFDILVNKYLPYCGFEVDDEKYLQYAGFNLLCDKLLEEVTEKNMLSLLTDIEIPLCEVLSNMEHEGFEIDTKTTEEYGNQLNEQIEDVKQQIFANVGHEFNPNSTKELGKVLFEELQLPTGKKTKTGYSTNADVLEKLRQYHPIVTQILRYRKLTKLHSTYIVGLLKEVKNDGRIHSTFNQTETRTGRISSTEPNVQNIPVRSAEGSKIREFFVAREGCMLVDADYSQIELRILAHIANDKNMIRAFENGDDIHAITASQILQIPLEEVTPQQRSSAKAINFGIVYGISPYSLSQDTGVSMAEAKTYINEYLKTYSGVAQYMKDIVKTAEEKGYVETLFNRRRELPDINSSNKLVKSFAERMALNTPIQGTAADVIKIAMVKVYQRLKNEGLEAKLILQVHDELIIESPILQAQMVSQLLKQEMQSAVDLAVSLLVDVHTGKNWYIAKG